MERRNGRPVSVLSHFKHDRFHFLRVSGNAKSDDKVKIPVITLPFSILLIGS